VLTLGNLTMRVLPDVYEAGAQVLDELEKAPSANSRAVTEADIPFHLSRMQPGYTPEPLPVRTDRHNSLLNRHPAPKIATHLARPLPRCPRCLRGLGPPPETDERYRSTHSSNSRLETQSNRGCCTPRDIRASDDHGYLCLRFE
jgi:hypothetical protein